MIHEAKKHSLLTGNEPIEEEEKTEAQISEEGSPDTLAESASLFDAAEYDETPAIERSIKHHGVVVENTSDRPTFNIDPKFEQEIKEREAAERKEREQKREEAERKAKAESKRREEKIERELKKSQTLDPEEIREKLAEENRKANENKLYPDAKPVASEIENAIIEKGGGLKGSRGSLVSVFDEKLAKAIQLAIGCQLAAVVFFFATQFIPHKENTELLHNILLAGVILLLAVSIFLIASGGNHTRHKDIPADQRSSFLLSTVIPGLAVRLAIITTLQILMAQFSTAISTILGAIVGAGIGASIHYSFLNDYNIPVSGTISFINCIVYIGYYITIMAPAILMSINGGASDLGNSLSAMYSTGIAIAGFFIADYMAMRLARKTTS